MAVRRIVVTIDRLQLHGVAREDAPALVAALRGELERSLAREADGAHGWTSAALAAIRLHPVHVDGGPAPMGRALGRAMAKGLAP
jgi:hypothetical protein